MPRDPTDQRREDLFEFGHARGILGDGPGCGGRRVFVRPRSQARHGRQSFVQQPASRAVHSGVIRGHVGVVVQLRVGARRGWHDAVEILLDHRDGAARQIAERVREITRVPLFETFPREVAVAIEGHFTQQDVAKRIGPVAVDRFAQVELHAGAFGEALAAKLHEPMRPHLLRQRQPRRFEHGRPDHDVKARDILADNVQISRPTLLVAGVGEAGCGEVVGQRVKPHVRALRLTVGQHEREWHGPVETGARRRDVVETLRQQSENFVATALRFDERRIRGQQILQKALILREPEEPVALLDFLERARGMQHALALDDIGVLLEGLTAHAIHAGIGALIKVIRIALGDHPDQRLHAGLVVRLGGANELIVRNAESGPDRLKARRDFIGEGLRRHAILRRGLLHLLAMFVHADQQMHVVAALATIARDHIGADLLERVAQMWIAIRVIDGGGQIESRHVRLTPQCHRHHSRRRRRHLTASAIRPVRTGVAVRRP